MRLPRARLLGRQPLAEQIHYEPLWSDGQAISESRHTHKNETFMNYPHVCVSMASKNITISEEAYRRLENLKKPNESFSVVITRLTGKRALSELFGVLAGADGERLATNLEKIHRARAKVDRRRSRRLREALD